MRPLAARGAVPQCRQRHLPGSAPAADPRPSAELRDGPAAALLPARGWPFSAASINEVWKAAAANSNSPCAAGSPPRAEGGGLAAPTKQGVPCHRVPPPRELRGGGSGSSPSRERLGIIVPVPHAGCPSPPPSLPRSQRRPRCDARGGEAAARAFAWAEGKAASPVCFIFSWQLRTAQRSSAPPEGRAGRQAREDRAGRAGGRTGHRRREVTAGELQPAGLRSAAAPGSRPAGCEQGQAGRDGQRPPALPRCGRGSPRAGDSVPGFSPAAAAARRGPADGQSWAGAGRGSASSRAPPA